MSGNDGGDVLPGPKKTLWGCGGCGTDGNWASRLRCRQCNKEAPQRVQAEARRHAKLLRAGPADRGGLRGTGAGGGGAGHTPAPWRDTGRRQGGGVDKKDSLRVDPPAGFTAEIVEVAVAKLVCLVQLYGNWKLTEASDNYLQMLGFTL